ncbi:7,8-didemethyl-8-hydroxy-5-deazariboflavin synthase subunit CofG [Nesterenkonia salmonea]|uniref:7,8-didemethyl-8-hydroxy-5-deazariboflavin synthase n=1 Tax=Nesterenkonia salmonea TaxID=1804987 RepID=A0A5R9BK48_9MICC|nr:7,8-didemethyl-8-hydroxy-5-deazariboflavin synthase CofG [Nesterenkonia salmonea]TLQ01098.1 7,8-didemethyl-8-hydroxy-5-deazariboflavin synthase subunit CofG [Nesterenkonia salmonea]
MTKIPVSISPAAARPADAAPQVEHSRTAEILARVAAGIPLTVDDAAALLAVRGEQLEQLLSLAAQSRDSGHGRRITYSRKVFIPLTTLCRDRCHYCTFVDTPGQLRADGRAPYLSREEVVEIARQGAALGCKEALFTLGDRPEERWSAAREWLNTHGYASTLEYVAAMAAAVLEETGLLPHLNPGVLSWTEMQRLRPLAPSMGMMLETTSRALYEQPGGAHYGSPDKDPALRLQVLDDAGRSRIPFTTGILLGIGETLRDRAESLFAIRDSHATWGHVQETIVQNFRAKPRTAMQNEPDLTTAQFIAAVAVARLVMGPEAHIQAPPNLTDPAELNLLIRAGIDDWGGVSPLTPDHVNPERPWPQIEELARLTADSGYELTERLTAHPEWLAEPDYWLDSRMHQPVAALTGAGAPAVHLDPDHAVLNRAESEPAALSDADYAELLRCNGTVLEELCRIADAVRADSVGDRLTYAVNRNVNSALYDPAGERGGLTDADLRSIAAEAAAAGATELCIQGLIPPELPGAAYFDLVDALRSGAALHLHAYRPAEIADAAARVGVPAAQIHARLIDHGVGSVPGTAARILDDAIRDQLTAGTDIPAARWLELIRSAHRAGLRSTATMNYGHIETPEHIVAHLRQLRSLQEETGGFTEFIAMPIIPQDIPVPGVTRMADDRLSRAVHAVSRLLLSGAINHVQAAWPKFGLGTAQTVLTGGADDLGGVLLDGTRPEADPEAGRSLTLADVRRLATTLGRTPVQRSTVYEPIGAAA